MHNLIANDARIFQTLEIEPQTEDLAAARQHSDSPMISNPRNTKVEQIVARVGSPQDQVKFHERCQVERITGTCEWIFKNKKFQLWLQRAFEVGDEILWCHGKPGIGKTMLAYVKPCCFPLQNAEP